MSRTSPKYIMYQFCALHAQHPCTSTMYIKNVPKDIIHGMYQPYANMCIHWYANHLHLPICQPCASTDMPTMCIYQHAKQCIISLMIYLHHEPSIINKYQLLFWSSNTNGICHIWVYQNMYTIMHQHRKMMNSIHVCQILHKTCANQPASRCLYQCTKKVPIMHQL